MGDAALGRPRRSRKALGWFVTASLVSLRARPGHGQPAAAGQEPRPAAARHRRLGQPRDRQVHAQGLRHATWCRKSIAEAMANNEILQIVVFSMFFGVALAALGEKAQDAGRRRSTSSRTSMLKITGYVMKLAPLAVFAAMAATVAATASRSCSSTRMFMGGFYLGLILLWALLVLAGFVFLGPRVFKLLRADQGAVPARVRDRELGGRLSEDPRALDRFGVQAQDLELRAADGLLVQPRRLDDVLHLRDAVHRAGLRHRAAAAARRSRCC